MKKSLFIVAIAAVFTACGNGSERSTNTDSTATSTTPPPTSDSTNTMGTMMGDTTKQVESDSTVGDTVK
jgi:hypothetical protein